jgi:peptidyl-prolyl cis-trans isomerase D
MEKIFHLKILESKWAMLKKSGQGITSTAAANRVWDQEVSVALLTSEFDKLGLRVGEKHLMEVLKADQNIGKIYVLNAAGILQNSRIL